MQKTVRIYILMIILIAGLIGLIVMHFKAFDYVSFPRGLHLLIEGTNTILMFLIFLVANNSYSKTKDGRFIILAGSFLICSVFNLVHIFAVTSFPYDTLTLYNIQKNPTLIYLLFCNLALSLAIYFSLIYKEEFIKQNNIKFKFYKNYLYLFLILTILPILIYHFLPSLLYGFYIIIHSLEFINYALFLMLATMLINLKFNYKQPTFDFFIVGLLFMGLGGLFYINPSLIQINGIIAHIFQFFGLLCILSGINYLPSLASLFRFKDELITYLSLLLTFFYIVFVAITSGIFKVVFPQYSGYVFIEFLLLVQLITYIISSMSWDKICKVYIAEERNRALIRIYESMHRISNSNIIKNSIIGEINNALKPDKCFIAIYNPENNSFDYDEYSRYLPSKILYNQGDLDNEVLDFKKFKDQFSNIEICFSNVDDYINRCSLKGTPQEKLLRDSKIKSIYSIPINYENQLLGYLVLEYRNEYKELNEDDFAFLKKMTIQIGISMN